MTNVPLAAQALVATTGIFPTRAPSQRDLTAASGLPARWRSRIRRWLAEPTAAEWTYVAPPEDFDRLQDRIIAPLNHDEVTSWLQGIDELELGTEYVAIITRARQYLDGRWPKISVPGLQATVAPLGRDEREQVWSLLRVLDEPDAIFDDWEAGALTPDQVTAWREIYPDLAEMVTTILGEAVIDFIAKKHELDYRREAGIRILTGAPPEATITVAPAAPSQGQGPQPAGGGRIEFKSLQTPSERVADRESK